MRLPLILALSLLALSANCQSIISRLIIPNAILGAPVGRGVHTIALDEDNQKLYLYGGFTTVYRNDLWELDMTTGVWTQLAGDPDPQTVSAPTLFDANLNPIAPSGRARHVMHYDSVTQKLYVFGGDNTDGLLGDTWAFDLRTNSWKYLIGSTEPFYSDSNTIPGSLRTPASVFASGIMWVLPGAGRTGKVEIWRYNTTDNTWLFVKPAAGIIPSGRVEHAVVLIGDAIYLFGGFSSGPSKQPQNDFYYYNITTNTWSSAWRALTACPFYGILGAESERNCIGPRLRATMVYNVEEDSIWVFGGNTNSDIDSRDYLNDLWSFSLKRGRWTWRAGNRGTGTLQLTNYPARRSMHVAIVHQQNNTWSMLLSGGKFTDGFYSSEVWKFFVSNETDATSTTTNVGITTTPTLPTSKEPSPSDFTSIIVYITVPCFALFTCAIGIFVWSRFRAQPEGNTTKSLSGAKTPIFQNSTPLSIAYGIDIANDLLFSSAESTIAVSSVLAVPGYSQYQGGVDYTFVRALAEGGSGEVYLVDLKNPQLRESARGDVAVVKALKVKNKNPSLMELNTFNQEVALMSMFGNYPQFVQFLGFDSTYMGIIMRYYPAGSLNSYRKNEQNPWSKRIICGFAHDIAVGVAVIHEKGFIHADLKMANILVDWNDQQQRPKGIITDLGMMKSVNNRRSVIALKAMAVAGATIPYAAPELLLSLRERRDIMDFGELAKAVDVYAISLIFCELLTRKNPWRNN